MNKPYPPLLTGNEPELDPPATDYDLVLIPMAWGFGVMLFVFLLIGGCNEHAFAYTDEDAIKTIVGEAANQGYIGMVAVGEVIRQRGSLKGFYGFKNVQKRRIGTAEFGLARKAWIASAHTTITHHADHFENIHAFGVPYWVKNCVPTFKYKDHQFYKEI